MEAQPKIRSYRDLLGWQKGIALARAVYKLTAPFPDGEKFGLVSQMRRAAVSVPSNIAEGQARRGRREFLQVLSHAEGSLAELDTQLILSVELGFLARSGTEEASGFIAELQKMLSSLRQKLASY
ncbi:MAG TPA: four helix bundle protein [Terriglobia bacterium]|nr:four helix bundle protein [Terriglobia bacterium]